MARKGSRPFKFEWGMGEHMEPAIPLMLGVDDVPQIREALESTPRLREILKEMFG